DASNRDPKFLRNRIRHELLPLLADSYNPEVAGALARVASLARETVGALDRAAGIELDRLAVWADGTATVRPDARRALPRPVAAEVLRQVAARLGSRAPLRAWAHRGLKCVLAVPAPRRAFRLGGVTVEVSGALARLASAPPPALIERIVVVPGRTELPEIGQALEARLGGADADAIPREHGRGAFDPDERATPLGVRAGGRGERAQDAPDRGQGAALGSQPGAGDRGRRHDRLDRPPAPRRRGPCDGSDTPGARAGTRASGAARPPPVE